jgi:hypothetical protein
MEPPHAGQPLAGPLPAEALPHARDRFDVYQVAIDDLHHSKTLGQSIDTLYVTILTLVLGGDAYVAAISRFDSWVPVGATLAIGIVGLAVTERWRQGGANLYRIITNRYAWLREAERHPDLACVGANFFTQEYETVYVPQKTRKQSSTTLVSIFFTRTQRLQNIFRAIFIVIPLLIAALTFLATNPWYHLAIQPLIQSK